MFPEYAGKEEAEIYSRLVLGLPIGGQAGGGAGAARDRIHLGVDQRDT